MSFTMMGSDGKRFSLRPVLSAREISRAKHDSARHSKKKRARRAVLDRLRLAMEQRRDTDRFHRRQTAARAHADRIGGASRKGLLARVWSRLTRRGA